MQGPFLPPRGVRKGKHRTPKRKFTGTSAPAYLGLTGVSGSCRRHFFLFHASEVLVASG